MLYNIQASIKKHIENKTSIPCVWIYDGVTLPATRPIITIEALKTSYGVQAKLRETVGVKYRFQIGVFSKTVSEGAQLPQKIADLLTFEYVPLIDTKNGGAVIGEIETTVTAITPILSEEADSAQKHKSYIDVTVAHYRGK